MTCDEEASRDLDTLSDWNRLHNQDPHIRGLVQTALNEIDYLLTKLNHLQKKTIPPQAGDSR